MRTRIGGPSQALVVATLATLVVATTGNAQSPSPGASVVPSAAPLPSPASPRSNAVCDLFLTADQVEACRFLVVHRRRRIWTAFFFRVADGRRLG